MKKRKIIPLHTRMTQLLVNAYNFHKGLDPVERMAIKDVVFAYCRTVGLDYRQFDNGLIGFKLTDSDDAIIGFINGIAFLTKVSGNDFIVDLKTP